jgi:sugar phosphate permease
MQSGYTTRLKAYYPWIIWALSASFFFYKYLLQVSPSVMSTELMSAYTLTGAGLGNLAACFFYAYFLMQIPVGIILDKWSPRIVMTIAVFFCALSTLVFSYTHLLFLAQLSRFIMGLTTAFAAVSCFKLAALWFSPKRFALVSGLSMTVAMLGAICGEAPLSFLVTHIGWRQTLKCIAVVGFVLCFLIWIIIKDKPSTQSKSLPHADENMSLATKFSIILKSKQTWLLSLYSGLAFAPLSVFGGLWGVSFIETAYRLNALDAAYLVSLSFVGFALGCPLVGWISDYIKQRKRLIVLGTVIALICISLVLYVPMSSFFLAVCLGLFGMGASCFFLCFSMIKELHPLIFTATVLGFMNTFDSICEAVTEPLIGKLLDLHWSGAYEGGARAFSVGDYHYGLLTLPIYLVISLFVLCFIRETYCTES